MFAATVLAVLGLVVAVAPCASRAFADPDPAPAATVFVSDAANDRVVEIPADGSGATTVASGFDQPTGIAVDAAGDVFVCDTFNDQVLEIPADGGGQKVIGSGFGSTFGVAVDSAGDVFVADTDNNRIVEVPVGGGSQVDIGSGLNAPRGVAVDAAGDVFIADTQNNRVVEVPADGSGQVVLTTDVRTPTQLALDDAGDLYIADEGNARIREIPADGSGETTIAADLNDPYGVAVDAAGNVYVADLGNDDVVEIPADGGSQFVVASGLNLPYNVAVFAPPPTFVHDTPGASAALGTPYSYTFTASAAAGQPAATFGIASGTLPPGLSLDSTTGELSGTPTKPGSYTFTVEADNAVTGSQAPPTTIAVSSPGAVVGIGKFSSIAIEKPVGGDQVTLAAGIFGPSGAAIDTAGNIYIADTRNSRIVELPADGGPQSTVVGGLQIPTAVAVDAAGTVYVADPGLGQVLEVPAGGGPETSIGTGLVAPDGVAVDAAGNVYISDNSTDKVVEVPADGSSQITLASGLGEPAGVTVDALGNVYVADFDSGDVIELPAGGGPSTTVASGFYQLNALAIDPVGNLYIADGRDGILELPADGGPLTTAITGLITAYGVAAYAPPPTFTADTAPTHAMVGSRYAYGYAASTPADEADGTFRVWSGSLPPGLTLDPHSGLLSGKPTTAGTYTFTAEVNNAATGTLAPATTITVVARRPRVALQVHPSPALYSEATTVKVRVSDAATARPVPGTVTLTVDGNAQTTAPTNGAGVVTFPLTNTDDTPLDVGTHTVDVTVTPATPRHRAVTKSTVVRVRRGATTTALTLGTTSMTARVRAVRPEQGTPYGSVVFLSGGRTLGTVALAGGVAILHKAPPAGKRIIARYTGVGDWRPSADHS